jgi:hypothetical protein
MHSGRVGTGEWQREGLEGAVERRDRVLLSLEFWHDCSFVHVKPNVKTMIMLVFRTSRAFENEVVISASRGYSTHISISSSPAFWSNCPSIIP